MSVNPEAVGEQQASSDDIYILHMHLVPRKAFSTLAEVIRCLMDHQPLIYRLEIMENDLIHTLVTNEESRRTALPDKYFTDRDKLAPFGETTCSLPGEQITDSVVRADFGMKKDH